MGLLRAIVDKALGYPRKGTHVGGGRHVTMPATWDGTGATPPGWAKSAADVWVASASDAVLPLPDDVVAELQAAPAQARLSAAEKTTLSSAIAGRSSVVLDGRVPTLTITATLETAQ